MPCNFIFYFSVNLCSLFLPCFICLVEMQHDSILKFQSNTIHLIIRNLNLPFTSTSFSAFLKIPGTIFANLIVSLITCQSDKANLLIKETLEILNLYIYIYIYFRLNPTHHMCKCHRFILLPCNFTVFLISASENGLMLFLQCD